MVWHHYAPLSIFVYIELQKADDRLYSRRIITCIEHFPDSVSSLYQRKLLQRTRTNKSVQFVRNERREVEPATIPFLA